MKCYFHYDEKSGTNILIPCCWGTVHTGEIEDCICYTPKTFNQYERERFNQEIKKLNEEIKYLEKEVKRLNKRVEYYHKKSKK